MVSLIGMAMLAGAAATPAPVEYHFEIGRAKGAIYNPWTLANDRVELRSFRGAGIRDGDFVAPTIRVAPGQQLTVNLDNRLEPCSADQRRDHKCFNDTNLHTHGLWVSPSGNSDNVLVSIKPGEQFRYEYHIERDHPAGTFWYHPHNHGSGYVQVASGMAGALIVNGNRVPTLDRPGDIDILLKDQRGRPFPERIMIFQQIQYGCLEEDGAIKGRKKTVVRRGIQLQEYVRPWRCDPGEVGRIEGFDHDRDWVQSGRFTGINGAVQPRLPAARVGRFERWRLIHAGTREPVRVSIHRLDERAPDLATVRGGDQEQWIKDYCREPALPVWQIAMDGLTRSSAYRSAVAPVFAGERLDILVRFPLPGRYCLVQESTRNRALPQPLRVLAVVAARGPARNEVEPAELLRAQLVRAAERALPGPGQAPIRDRVVADLNDGLKLSSFVWHRPVGEGEVSNHRELTMNILESPGRSLFHVNGRPFDHDRVDFVLPLGRAEEWHLASLTGFHPLHMHVNPFQIVSITDALGRDVTDPNGPAFDPDFAGLKGEWKDTIFVKERYRATFRSRYEKFTGEFVAHCHVQLHGDRGMMIKVRIDDLQTPDTAIHTDHTE